MMRENQMKKRKRTVQNDWDMTKCKKNQELERIIADAWKNIHKGQLKV